MSETTPKPISGRVSREVPVAKGHIAGKITQNIGTGENAKNSIVWMTITWSFSIACGLSFLFLVVALFKDGGSLMEDVKSIWGLFVPIITLALGYAFGKSK